MITDEVKKRSDMARLNAELQAANIELLSAQCAADRLRMQHSVRDIAAVGDRETLKRAIAAARALNRFFTEVEGEFAHEKDEGRG
jgi:hypothetical protein